MKYTEVDPVFSTDRRTVLRAAAVLGATSGGLLQYGAAPAHATSTTAAGGPVVLMGIDAEDGGVGGHGPISAYVSVMNSILGQVSNGGSGILVIGENGPAVTEFWDEVGRQTGESVTYISGAYTISNQRFSGFAMLAVVSSYPGTVDGMRQAENDALAGRAADVAAFVNGGGGLFGSSQTNFTNAWAYVGSLGSFSIVTGQNYDNIDPTTDGTSVGVTDVLDVYAWHDAFTEWPPFLNVLAWRTGMVDKEAAALGGAKVVIGTCSQTYDLCAGQDIAAGSLTVTETSDGYDVTYETSDDWSLVETHLDVGDEFGDFHTSRKGNPKIGRFDYAETHDGVTSYTYNVSLDDPQLDDVDAESDCVLFAAHAVVEKQVDDEVVSETAWACADQDDAVSFVDGKGGSWATYVRLCCD